MRKMKATAHGYFGGKVIEPGEVVHWPHSNTPFWLKEIGKAEAQPARDPLDHDGDGRKGGSVPKKGSSDLDAMTVKELRELAKEHKIDLDGATAKAAIVETISKALAVAEQPEPFADAPAPQTVAPAGNGLQEALGGVHPDWVPPGTQI